MIFNGPLSSFCSIQTGCGVPLPWFQHWNRDQGGFERFSGTPSFVQKFLRVFLSLRQSSLHSDKRFADATIGYHLHDNLSTSQHVDSRSMPDPRDALSSPSPQAKTAIRMRNVHSGGPEGERTWYQRKGRRAEGEARIGGGHGVGILHQPVAPETGGQNFKVFRGPGSQYGRLLPLRKVKGFKLSSLNPFEILVRRGDSTLLFK